MDLCHRQNDNVCTPQVFEPNTKNHKFLSPTGSNVFPSPCLPSELIVEILLRLPARCLLQFRCVCKLWKTLISDPKFAKKHFLISIADPSMTHLRFAFCDCSCPLNSLFENPSTRVIPDRFKFDGLVLENPEHYYMLGSCNGFLCLYDPDQCNMIMYNPSIGLKSKSSPKIITSPDWAMLYDGFGYDHVNDKYKVLAFVERDDVDLGESFTKIYTFGEDSWRTIQDLPYRSHSPPSQRYGKYVSGTLNWVGSPWIYPRRYVITSFDLDKETYRDLLLPQHITYRDYMCEPSLCVLNDCLCLCFVNKTHFVVWLMKEYGIVESWTKFMNIPREKLIFLNSIHKDSIIELLFISENGIVLLMVSSQLILYNLNSGGFDYPLISSDDVYDPQIYCENLISPLW